MPQGFFPIFAVIYLYNVTMPDVQHVNCANYEKESTSSRRRNNPCFTIPPRIVFHHVSLLQVFHYSVISKFFNLKQ